MDIVFKNKIFTFLLLIFGLMLFPAVDCFAGDKVKGRIVLTANPASVKHIDVFSSYEKIYAVVNLTGLGPGKHTAVVNWVSPQGEIDQQTVFTFTNKSQSPYTFHSWFRLMKNGPLKSGFTGKQFDEKYLGIWGVHVFVDDIMLKKESFEIY